MALHTADDGTRSALLGAGVLFIAVLAGCVEQSGPGLPGRPARLLGEGFFPSDNPDEGYKLVYGRDGTDDVLLMLECRPGSQKIDIFDFGHSGGRQGQMLILTSGRVQSALSPTLEPDEESGGVDIIAHAASDLPALDGFRRSGQIAVKMGSRAYTLSATAPEKAEIARFFSGCGRK